MRRRTLLTTAAAVGTLGTAGCLGQFDTGSAPSTARPPATTCTDPPWNDPVDVQGTPNTSKEGNLTGFTYALEVEHGGVDGTARVAIRFAEEADEECQPVAFQRVFELDPGERDIVREPLGKGGEYTLIADLKDGGRATTPVEAHDDGIGSAKAYFVEVSDETVTIDSAVA